jgi:O-antigen ligase
LTVGSVVYAPIRALIESLMSDPTFTGRNVIWTFAIEHTAQRPILGFGFQAFWGTNELVEAWNPQESWGYRASDAHNSFLDLSVMTGIVGMALASIWIVAQPIMDYLRSRWRTADPAITTLFMQIWFFGLCESAFEAIYFSGGSAIWFMVVVAIIGLRFQNSFHLCR